MFDSLLISSAWAQAAESGAQQHPSTMETWFPFLIIPLIFFFLVIRPQQRRSTTHKSFLGGLKRGDSVLTSGGILGTIEGLTDQFVTLQVADGVKIRILRTQIASGIGDEVVKK